MDDGFTHDDLGVQAHCEAGPDGGVGADTAVEHLALLDQGIVDVECDDFKGAKGFGNVEEPDDVGDKLVDVAFVEVGGEVVVRSKDIVVVFEEW